MPFNEQDKLGIVDLLYTEEQNRATLLQLAKSVTKNVCDIATTEEALDYIFTHIEDTVSLLNKRPITKEILFKYLHHKKIPVKSDFTKGALVNKVIEYWKTAPTTAAAPYNSEASNSSAIYDTNKELRLESGDTYEYNVITSYTYSPNVHYNNITTSANELDAESQYPIHLLARKFSEWFFDNYNKSILKVEDFWSDAHLQLRVAANDRMDEHECVGAVAAMESLMNYKLQFGFHFNPNLTHSGVQGRIDVHGLVLVLTCGTLHTQENCVGVFECTFGLLRDPFAENNWKVKTIQCTLRSQGTVHVPSLYESDTLRDALLLPVPSGELT